MSELTPGWETATIGDVAELIRGVTYVKSEARSAPTEGYSPMVRATNITSRLVLEQDLVFIPDGRVRPEQWLQKDDIVIASSSGSSSVVGKSARLPADWPGAFGAFCAVLRSRPELNPRYLAHYVASPSVRRRWSTMALGTNINNLKPGDIKATPIPIPPAADQERIVAAIEKGFSRIDAGDEQLKAARERARVLTASALRSLISTPVLVPLSDVLISLRNGIFVSRPGRDITERRILRISAVRPLVLDTGDVRYLPDGLVIKAEDEFRLASGDLLFTRYNGNAELVGACALVPPEGVGLLYPDKLIRARVRTELADPGFIELAMNFGISREAIRSKTKTTAGQAGISGSELKAVPLPLPPIAKQRAIVAQVRVWVGIALRTEHALDHVMAKSGQLRRSTLNAAFSE